MKLSRITLNRVPGITESFTLDDISPEINIVVGPNGSGKTSLCRALAAILWPGQDTSTQLEVETVWNEKKCVLHAERRSRSVSWEHDGIIGERPSLPDDHLAGCYRLSVRDLMQEHNEADLDIAQRIRLLMAGGYNIQALIDQRFSVKPNVGAKESKKIIKLQRNIADVNRKFSELAAAEDRLVDLEESLQEAKKAEQEKSILELATELANLVTVIDGLDKNLSACSPDLGNFTGDENERVGQLQKERADCDVKIARYKAELDESDKKAKEARLDAKKPKQSELKSWLTRMATLHDYEREYHSACEKKKQKKAALAHALENLGGNPLPATAPNLSEEVMDEVASLVKHRDYLTSHGSALRTQIEVLKSSSSIERRDTLLQGAGFLRSWLAAPQNMDSRTPAWLYVFAGLSVVVGLALAYLHNINWLVFSGIGVGMLFVSIVLTILRKNDNEERPVFEGGYLQAGLEKPDHWSHDAVAQRLRSIEEQLAQADLAETQNAQRTLLEKQLEELEYSEAEHEQKRAELQQNAGINITSELSLADLVYCYKAYRDASEALSDASALVTYTHESCSRVVKDAGSFLSIYGYEPDVDAAGLESQIQDLKERLTNYDNALHLHSAAVMRIDVEESQRLDLLQRTNTFYTERGLDQNDKNLLAKRLEELPLFKELKQEREQCIRRSRQLERRLNDRGDLLGLTEEQARELGAKAAYKASELTGIATEIGTIENRVKEARKGDALEVEVSRLNEARASLASLCEEAQRKAAGRFLLEDVDREHERVSRPPVMERAAEYFRTFTKNTYELQLPDTNEPEFRARDTSSAKNLTLSQLSDGTRIQLLLAVRIAFAIDAEHGTTAPLMFDEALSTADPERFRAVAESLAILARGGRQIFYMTSNPADVLAWKSVCSSDGVDAHVIDLAQVRGGQAAVSDATTLNVPAPPEVPEPGGMSAEQYAIAIKVPLANARKPVESLHLFYVLRNELPTLYTLIRETRITTVGQWLSLSASGRAAHFLSDDACGRIDALCQAAQEVYTMRAIGRGKPIDSEALLESGAVTETFNSRLVSLANDLDGDVEKFLDAFEDRSEERVKGFRSDAKQRLRAYLEEHGYLDLRPVLGMDDIHLRTMIQMNATIDTGVVTREECSRFVDQLLSVF